MHSNSQLQVFPMALRRYCKRYDKQKSAWEGWSYFKTQILGRVTPEGRADCVWFVSTGMLLLWQWMIESYRLSVCVPLFIYQCVSSRERERGGQYRVTQQHTPSDKQQFKAHTLMNVYASSCKASLVYQSVFSPCLQWVRDTIIPKCQYRQILSYSIAEHSGSWVHGKMASLKLPQSVKEIPGPVI